MAAFQREIMYWDEAIISFYQKLKVPELPHGIGVLSPFQNEESLRVWKAFYHKFYHDQQERVMMIGINPGRFGAGITGIPFTDPIRLANNCVISNTLAKKAELSSVFIYSLAEAYGGVVPFFNDCYFSSVSPVGFVRNDKNINYYDDANLQKCILPFAIQCMQEQLLFPALSRSAIVIGEGKNFAIMQSLNEQYGWFQKLVPLSHPRFVMQYKRRNMEAYIDKYIDAIHSCKQQGT